jgi:hypothetical protein
MTYRIDFRDIIVHNILPFHTYISYRRALISFHSQTCNPDAGRSLLAIAPSPVIPIG